MEQEDIDKLLLLDSAKNWLRTFPKQSFSMVVIRDHSSPSTNGGSADDFSVFPPSNHENLPPNSDFKHNQPPSPSSPLTFLPSDNDDDLPPPPSPPPPPPPQMNTPAVALLPKWWNFAVQILCSRFRNVGSFWSLKNVGVIVTVVFWWFWARKRRRKMSVEYLMQIISEKDKKIMELLNQIAQMNEVLLSRHKALLASKLPN